MDLNYWIILIIIYLISQWLRRRARAQRTREVRETPSQEPGEEVEEAGIPQWLKDLGIVEYEQEEDVEPAVIPEEPEVPPPDLEEVEKEVEKIADVALEEEFPPPEPVVAKPWRELPPEGKSISEKRYGALIYDPENLRDYIVVREILGPPRALHRHRPLSRF